MAFISSLIVLFSLIPLYRSFIFFVKRKFNSAILYYPVFFLFFIYPLILDIIYGKPVYPGKFHGFSVAYDDYYTSLIYLVFVFLLVLVFIFFQLKPKFDVKFSLYLDGRKDNKSFFTKLFLWFFILLGPASIFYTSNPLLYLEYGAVRKFMGSEIYSQHATVWMFSFLSALCVIFYRLISVKSMGFITTVLLFSILLLDIYINNKRFIFIFPLLFFIVDYIYAAYHKKINLILILCSCLFLFFSYSSYEKFEYTMDRETKYLYHRLEWGRDDVMKFVIHEKIVKGSDILEYPGQSFLYSIFGYVPREVYNFLADDKPYPYAQYVTNKLIYDTVGAALIGWSMTTSIYDEFIANFGVLGFLFVILFIVYFLVLIDKEVNGYLKFFYLVIFALLTVVQTAPYLFLIYIFIFIRFYMFFSRCRFHKS